MFLTLFAWRFLHFFGINCFELPDIILLSRCHFDVKWELSYHTSKTVGITKDIDEKELCAVLWSDEGMLNAFIQNAHGDDERRRVP